MATMLSEAPKEIGKAVDVLNKLRSDLLAEICDEAMQFLQYKIGAIKTDTFYQQLKSSDVHIDQKSLQSAINAVVYIFRASIRHRLTTVALEQHLSNSLTVTPTTVEVLAKAWENQGKVLLAAGPSTNMLNTGKLMDMQWKLGVATSSDGCKNLNSPYVSMTIKIADPARGQIIKTFEMSIPEFHNFHKQMKEMASSIEMV